MSLLKLIFIPGLFFSISAQAMPAEKTRVLDCLGVKDKIEYRLQIYSNETTTRIEDEVDGYFELNFYTGSKLTYQNQRVMISYASDEFFTTGENHLILSNPHQNRGDFLFLLKGSIQHPQNGLHSAWALTPVSILNHHPVSIRVLIGFSFLIPVRIQGFNRFKTLGR